MVGRHLPVFGNRSIAVTTDELSVFGQEHHGGNACSAAHAQFIFQCVVGVAIDVADLNCWGCIFKMIEDWALFSAVSAPSAGHAKHLHFAFESAQQGFLGVGQRDALMHTLPPAAMFLGTVGIEKLFVTQGTVERSVKIDHGLLLLGSIFCGFLFAGNFLFGRRFGLSFGYLFLL